MIGNRLVGLVTLVLLGWLLSVEDFGFYSLNATNALLFQIVSGWWITSSAYKFLAHRDHALVDDYIRAIATSALVASAAAAGIALLFTTLVAGYSLQIAALVGTWSVALIIYDLTLAGNNGLGNSRPYAALSMTRNVLALIFSVGAILLGFGPGGAMLGQILSLVVPLALLRSANAFWARALRGRPSREKIADLARFGVAGMCVLGIYILTQALARNLIEDALGLGAAGQFSYAVDLWNAPLLLLGTTFSLSKMRTLYRAGGDDDAAQSRIEAARYVELFIILGLGYAAVGAVVGPELAKIFGTTHLAVALSMLAGPATMISASIQIISATMTSQLVAERRTGVILQTVCVLGLVLAAGLFGEGLSLLERSWAIAGALALATIALIVAAAATGSAPVDLKVVVKALATASVVAAIGAASLAAIGAGPLSGLIAALVCAASFLLLTQRWKLVDWRAFLLG